MSYKLQILGAIICFAVGYGSAKHQSTSEVKLTKTEVQTHETSKAREHTVTTIEEKPDGTKLTQIDQRAEAATDEQQTSTQSITDTKTTSAQDQWTAGLYKTQSSYVGTIDRRVLGPVSIGLVVRQPSVGFYPQLATPEVGVGITVSF